MPTMREYVDAMRGDGTWDDMQDRIDRKELLGWELVPVSVDGATVHIFPGSDRDVTLDRVRAEIRKAIGQIERGEAERVEHFDD